MTTVLDRIWNNLGHCMKCMRTAFRFWLAVSVMSIVYNELMDPNWFALLLASISTAALVLWAVHVIAFAMKFQGEPSTRPGATYANMFPGTIRLLSFAIVASAIPALAPNCPDGRSQCGSEGCCGRGKRCCCVPQGNGYCEERTTPCVC